MEPRAFTDIVETKPVLNNGSYNIIRISAGLLWQNNLYLQSRHSTIGRTAKVPRMNSCQLREVTCDLVLQKPH